MLVMQDLSEEVFEENKALGEIAYQAYCEVVGFKTWDGRTTPKWDDLTKVIRHAWTGAALRIQYNNLVERMI